MDFAGAKSSLFSFSIEPNKREQIYICSHFAGNVLHVQKKLKP